MFDTMHDRVVVLTPPAPPEESDADAEALKQGCLHPAELWALKRRAGRPHLAPRRLPAVARVG